MLEKPAAPAAAAVVVASRDEKDVMRKLMAMEKIFAKQQENEQ